MRKGLVMNEEPREHWMLGNGSFHVNPYADVDDLLNDAAEWLSCARALMDLLKEAVAKNACADQRRTMFALEAISILTLMGSECVVHAHERVGRS